MHTLTVQIPDDIYEPLLLLAQRTGQTPEDVIAECIAATIQPPSEDPLIRLLGSLESDVTDLGERHDYYIGQGLLAEIRNDA